MRVILALLLLISISFKAQKKDTIFTKDNKTIPCKITLVNNANIFYNDGDFISLAKVNFYSQNGQRSNHLQLTDSQINKSITRSAEAQNFKPTSDTIDIHQELFFIKQNLGLYHQEKMTGFGLTFAGYGVSILGGALTGIMEEPEIGLGLIIAGGVTSIIGGIVIIDSHKWIKRASLGLTGNGAFVRYKF